MILKFIIDGFFWYLIIMSSYVIISQIGFYLKDKKEFTKWDYK